MTIWATVLSVILGLAVNECCELSPWAAKKVVRWSARLHYGDPTRAEIRGEELVALIETRPGKLFKLITALRFAAAALRPWMKRVLARLRADVPVVSGDGTLALKKTAIVAAVGMLTFTSVLLAETAINREPTGISGIVPPSVLTGLAGSINSVAFSADGKVLAASDTHGTVRLWDLADPRHPSVALAVGTGSIESALSPDGRTLAAAVSLGAAGTEVQLWDVADPARPIRLDPLRFPHATTAAVAFSPDGKTLAVGGAADQGRELAGRVWLFNVSDPAHPVHVGPVLPGPAFAVVSVAFSRVGGLLAESGGDSTIWIWNIANPAHPVLYSTLLKASASSVVSVDFSPDRRLLATASGNRVQLWNLAQPTQPTMLATLSGPAGFVRSVAFGDRGKILAAGSLDDAKAWLWNLANLNRPAQLGQPLSGSTGVSAIAFSLDQTTLAVAHRDGIQLWNLNNDAAVRRITSATDSPIPTGIEPGPAPSTPQRNTS